MLLCIGHITHDRIVTPTLDLHCPGGTSWYFAWGIHSLITSLPQGSIVPPYRLITSVGPDDVPSVVKLQEVGIPVENIPSRATVYFENRYGQDMNQRTQQVLSKADPFSWQRLEPLLGDPSSDDVFLLGSLLADDFPLDVLRHLHERGTVVADVQGYLRYVDGTKVIPTDWPDKLQALPYIDILKVNEQEMVVLTGQTDPVAAARQIGEWGVAQVLLTLGDQGSFIYTAADGSIESIPAYQPQAVVDATGCGDTYVMGYLFRRAQGASLPDAARFGAAVASLKLEHSGPFSATYADVLHRISKLTN